MDRLIGNDRLFFHRFSKIAAHQILLHLGIFLIINIVSGLLLQKAIQRQIDRFFLIQLIVYNQNCLSSRKMFFVYMHVLLV